MDIIGKVLIIIYLLIVSSGFGDVISSSIVKLETSSSLNITIAHNIKRDRDGRATTNTFVVGISSIASNSKDEFVIEEVLSALEMAKNKCYAIDNKSSISTISLPVLKIKEVKARIESIVCSWSGRTSENICKNERQFEKFLILHGIYKELFDFCVKEGYTISDVTVEGLTFEELECKLLTNIEIVKVPKLWMVEFGLSQNLKKNYE